MLPRRERWAETKDQSIGQAKTVETKTPKRSIIMCPPVVSHAASSTKNLSAVERSKFEWLGEGGKAW